MLTIQCDKLMKEALRLEQKMEGAMKAEDKVWVAKYISVCVR